MQYSGSIRTLANTKKITEWLGRNGLSEKDLAGKLGYDFKYFKKVLHQKEGISIEFMKKLCDATGLDVKDVAMTERKNFFIGDQIRKFRLEKGMSQEELGKAIGKSKKAISAYETGVRDPGSKVREGIADYFGKSVGELHGAPAPKEKYPLQRIPIISWVHANKFEEIPPSEPPTEYIFSEITDEGIFALKVENDCMFPEFNEGDIIIIHPGLEIKHNDFVVIADREANSATFKQYKEYGTKRILHPLNPKYKDIELDHKKQYVVVGKIVEKVKKY
jgi:repressor LexA